MRVPLQIHARNFELTEAIRTKIIEKASKLDNFYLQIMKCRITVEAPHRHHREGKLYDIRIDIAVPGTEFLISREPNEDIYIAIRDAFNAAYRKLEDYARRQRGDVKFHAEQPRARITALFPADEYGFITTPEGREIYFHRNSLLNSDFRSLETGMEVHFVEQDGEKGPQASSVSII